MSINSTRFLLKRIIDKKNEMRKELISLAKAKDYNKLKIILDEQSNKENLERK